MADDFTDSATKHQVAIERIKSGFNKKFAGVAASLRAKMREIFSSLEIDSLDELSRKELAALLVALEDAQIAITGAYLGDFEKELGRVAEFSAKYEVAAMGAVDTGALAGFSLVAPTKRKLLNAALRAPIQATGDLLKPFIDEWPKQDAQRVNKTIRTGWAQGKTSQEMVRQLTGTKSQGYKDGILDKSTRGVAMVVNTATQHVSTQARLETWQDDKKLGLGYYWSATLDRRTTTRCRAMDELHGIGSKNPLQYGSDPMPPLHPNCRSTIVPQVPKDYEYLYEGQERASSGEKPGPVDGELGYYSWLKTQSAEFQDFAIGPKRGKLLRNGGLTSKEFADLSLDKNFQPLTLEEMEAVNAEAFKKANVKP